MSEAIDDLLSAFDGHDVDGVRRALDARADPRPPVRGKLPINWLLEQYTRSDRLTECLRLLLDHGATCEDPLVLPVLLDHADGIRSAFAADPSLLEHRTTMVSSFTSLNDVTLLHVAAEYGNQNAARALIELGADVNARAAVDAHGCNGHTPIFHTVNSNANRSEPIMKMLVEAGADCSLRVRALVWGKGFDWETVFFDVTPISFAQLGLLPQVHRRENDIYANIKYMIEASGGKMPRLENVPNRYLQPKANHT